MTLTRMMIGTLEEAKNSRKIMDYSNSKKELLIKYDGYSEIVNTKAELITTLTQLCAEY